jgi:hypothetical protein
MARPYPAGKLLALYALRWEQEIAYHECKVLWNEGDLLGSFTPLTAIQEIAVLLIGMSLVVEP